MSSNPTPAYTSYAQLLKWHDDLLRLLETTPDEIGNADVWAQAQTLVSAGSDLGKLLDTSRERRAAQSILDYWANTLRRADQDTPPARLASFDPTLAPKLPDLPCPYRGLNAFTDAQFFYGREEVTATVLQKLRDGVQLVAVVGPSGSGKSSLVLGGVLDALKQGAVREADGSSDSAAWHTLPTLLPGQHALTRLNAVLEASAIDHDAHAAKAWVKILVIDQFEELFTLTRDEAQSHAFAERLMAWLAQGNRILLSLRSDFEERMQGLPALYEAFEHGRVDLRPMSIAALRSTIEKPAAEVGLRFDEGIVDDVLGKILGVNEGLPLLQFTLLKLWKLRQRNRITWEVYRRLGEDPRRALGKTAEELYQRLTPARQSIAKRLLLKLVTPKEGENEFTRKRLSRSELEAGENPERVTEVLQKLLEEGLLRSTGNEAQIEVMHEALVRNWPTLDQWLRDERSSLERRFLLQRRATRWHEDGRPSQTGLSGRDLEEAVRLEGLDELTQAYVDASVAAQQANEARERNRLIEQAQSEERAKLRETQLQQAQATAKAERRRRQVVSVLLAISLIASAVAGWAIWQSQKALARATTAERIARSRELTAVAQIELGNNVETGVLIAIAANEAAETAESRKILEQGLAQSVKSKLLSGHTRTVYGASWSPDGRQVLTTSDDKTARIWDTNTGKTITTFSNVILAIWSPDGKQILTASSDNTAHIWNTGSGMEVTLSGHTAKVTRAIWSPDGRQVHTTSDDKTARIWDTSTGKTITTLSKASNLEWSPDSKQVLGFSYSELDRIHRIWDANTGNTITTLVNIDHAIWSPGNKQLLGFSYYPKRDNTAHIWDANTGNTITTLRHPDYVNSAVWSPDGKQVLTTSDDNTARIWDANTGNTITTLRYAGYVNDAIWSPDGKQVLIVSKDNTARIWDPSTGNTIATLRYASYVNDVIWSPDGKQVLIASDDKTAQIWEANTGKEITILRDVTAARWSPDGKQVLTTSRDNTARIWDPSTDKPIITFGKYVDPDTIRKIRWSPDGKQLLVTGSEFWPDIWDASTGKIITSFRDADSAIWSPDGKQLLLTGWGSNPDIRDTSTGKTITSFSRHTDWVSTATWSPDGKQVLTASRDKTARISDTSTGKEIITLSGHTDWVLTATWSPDGKQVLTASKDKTARIWDASTGKRLTTLSGHTDEVTSAVWSPDGKQVLTASRDKTARIWDASTGKTITTLSGHTSWVDGAVWSPDGKQVLTASPDKTARIWDTNTGKILTTLSGHTSWVYSAVWSPDGKQVLTASDDKSARIWDVNTGKEITRLTGHTASVNDAQWSPDGKRIATASDDGTVRLYYANIEDLIAVAKTYVTRELTCEERVRYLNEERDCTKQP